MAAQEEGKARSSTTSSLPSSSDRSSTSALNQGVSLSGSGGMESDEEIRRVPEMGAAAAAAGEEKKEGEGGVGQRRKRGRSAGDKEQSRLKRLLRNRVSAQQARERKKAYVTELEAKAKDLELRNAQLEHKVSTLHNENNTLRQILKNTTAHAHASRER